VRNTFHDLETYSTVNIKDGTHRYAEEAEVMLWAFADGNGTVYVWDLVNGALHWQDPLSELWASEEFSEVDEVSLGLYEILEDEDALVWFQNGGMFDFVVLAAKMPHLLPPMHRWRDTMVQAFAHGLPGALEKLGDVLQLHEDHKKIKRGRELVRLFCMPTKDGGRNTKQSHPKEWQEVVEYAAQDITTMREVHRKLPKWNYGGDSEVSRRETALWHLDLRINSRGVLMDMDLARNAVRAVEQERARLGKQTHELTGGAVENTTQRDATLAFIAQAHGITLPDLQADTIERRLRDPDVPDALRELLANRLQASSNSVSKYKTLLRGVSKGGRMRGTKQFCGAGRTGRWAGRLMQLDNMPRPTLPYDEIEIGIAALKVGAEDLVCDNVIEACSNAIRSTIIAPPGKKLVVADLANIEGRTAAWLAGEEWKLQAFRDYDAGTGEDLYKMAYVKAFNTDAKTVTKHNRQIGKVQELMFSYGGGVGAWLTGAATYGIDLEAMTEAVWPVLDQALIAEAADFLKWLYQGAYAAHEKRLKANKITEDESLVALEAAKLKARMGLTEKTFIACDAIKRAWRYANPAISSYWKGDAENPGLEYSTRMAIENPGVTYKARRLRFRRDGAWLRIVLPSGRALCYPQPSVDEEGKISYLGLDPYKRTWGRVHTYGGKLCLAVGTKVLTQHRGWVPIEQVTSVDRVWDGDAWVKTGGAIRKGRRETIEAYGARMTKDHEVLTLDGWKHASQSKRHHRALCRLPDGIEVPRQRREEVPVDLPLCLPKGDCFDGNRSAEAASAGSSGFMRMQTKTNNRSAEHQTRHVDAPSVWSVARHAGPLPPSFASRVAQLRAAWDQGVRAVAKIFRCFLGRHGPYVRAWADARTPAQQRQLHTQELCMGYAFSAGQQHATNSVGVKSLGVDDADTVLPTHRVETNDGSLSSFPWSARKSLDRSPRRVQEVFDLLNCGPRNRFVIAAGGAPLIVHNCENVCQAVARDQLAEGMLKAEKHDYATVLHVHDELVTEVPDTEDFSAEALARLMCVEVEWNKGLPLAAAGFETYRYRKE
jgi:DNA polymerase